MGFSRQEYWSGLPFPSPGDLPDPGVKPKFLALLALASGCFTTMPPGKLISYIMKTKYLILELKFDYNLPFQP